MSALMTLTVAIAAVSALLATTVAAVYWRNHRQLRSPFTLALGLFAAFFLFHNIVLIYHLTTMMATFSGQAEWFLFAEGVLQMVALGALAYATLR